MTTPEARDRSTSMSRAEGGEDGVEKPKRIQLRRTKGWRLPEGAVVVSRPGKWGNPFPIGGKGPLGRQATDAEGAVGFFQAMLRDPELREAAGYPPDLSPLRGHDLACWCPLTQTCHADVLLEIANSTPALRRQHTEEKTS